MGTKTYKSDPALSHGEVFHRYDAALETLTCRFLAEPYNAHQVEADIRPPMMIGTYGEVLAEAVKQFRRDRQYSPQSVAIALARDKSSLINWTLRDAEIDLPAAWQMFLHCYEQWVEIQIAESVPVFIRDGLSSAEIVGAADKLRRQAGITAREVSDDGKAEFEKDLLMALDGKVVEYPVRPPLQAIRDHMPYFEPGEYAIVAGRTGMGKSYFAINSIYECCTAGVPSIYVNLENKPKHVQKRLWQMHTRTAFERNMSGISSAEIDKRIRAWEEVKNFPTKVIQPGRDLARVTNAIRQAHYESGVQLAVIDYIQLMRDGSQKRDRLNELAEISAELRMLALDLNIAVLGLAQMNRETEKSADKRPNLTGLRGSGDLEQDATAVFLLYVPGYYNLLTDDDGNPYPEEYADIHIAKGRESGPGFAKCRFNHVRGFYDPEPVPAHHNGVVIDYSIPANARPNLDEDIPF